MITVPFTMDDFKNLLSQKEVVIFGAGEYCMRFLNRLSDDEIAHISYIVDYDSDRQGKTLYNIPIKSPNEIYKQDSEKCLVVIATEFDIPQIYNEIQAMGNYAIIPACILLNDVLSQVAQKLYDNRKYIKNVKDILYDEKSKFIYEEVIRRRILYGKCDFSDLIVKGDAEYRIPIVYEKNRPNDEIIIDCGAYNGDTLKKFVETYGTTLQKIYLFECMEESISDLKRTISQIRNKEAYPEMILMPYALSDKDGMMQFAKTNKPKGSFLSDNRKFAKSMLYESEYIDVNVKKLDDIIPKNEKITMIKMDIEGSEFAALHGAEQIIKTNKPRLAISIYHCGEDYIRIPLYLKNLVPEYKFAIRHHNKTPFDTDLYCWME